MKQKKGKEKEYPSLYDAFELGDRVKRICHNSSGKNLEYKGIVLAIDDKGIEIYWDTRNGKYRPGDMDIAFTNCPLNEIFSGNEEYTPIKRDK
ncbi:MAG: hypothetical protein U9O49_04155 [Candidatus Thermoplasmatota archaeon]|nr:hypothetical protein [Candidatus Thermoplasmatota archaeon]